MTVEALRSRRPETLAELLDAHGREIQAVAWLILRDRLLAEDVTIETLLTAFEKAGQIRDDAALRPWLLRVATNRALSMRRRSARVVDLTRRPGSRPRRATSPPTRRTTSRSSPASRTCPCRCGPRSSSATTPISRSRRSRRPSARARTRSRPSSRPRSIGCADRSPTSPGRRPRRPAMHDDLIERRLRDALRDEGDGLAFTITPAELERRLALRRRRQPSGRPGSSLAAAVGIGLVGVAGLVGGWFDRAPDPTPAPSTARPLVARRRAPSRDRRRAARPGADPADPRRPDRSADPSTLVLAQAHGPEPAVGSADVVGGAPVVAWSWARSPAGLYYGSSSVLPQRSAAMGSFVTDPARVRVILTSPICRATARMTSKHVPGSGRLVLVWRCRRRPSWRRRRPPPLGARRRRSTARPNRPSTPARRSSSTTSSATRLEAGREPAVATRPARSTVGHDQRLRRSRYHLPCCRAPGRPAMRTRRLRRPERVRWCPTSTTLGALRRRRPRHRLALRGPADRTCS